MSQFTTDLLWDMMSHVQIYAQFKSKILYVYASDTYGFESVLWGKPQETVMSHFLTFVNHGCNGTANLGDVSVCTPPCDGLSRVMIYKLTLPPHQPIFLL
jgi:hypothetical protein